jgi:hypothetical protein
MRLKVGQVFKHKYGQHLLATVISVEKDIVCVEWVSDEYNYGERRYTIEDFAEIANPFITKSLEDTVKELLG